MELIIFAGLYQVKGGLISTFIFYRTFYLRGAAEVVLPFLHMNKASAAKKMERSHDVLRGHSALRGRILRIMFAFTSLPLLVVDSPLFFHHIDMP